MSYFINLWSKAVGSENYEKQEWMDLENAILDLGKDVIRPDLSFLDSSFWSNVE